MKTMMLFVITAFVEIAGCYLPYAWLKHGKPAWLLIPGIVCLAAFAWLISLHPIAAGRTYAAYGGVYVTVALFWLWGVEGIKPDAWDFLGAAVALVGMGIIVFSPHHA